MVRLDNILGEPWRIECPHCSAPCIVRIYSSWKCQNKDYGTLDQLEAIEDKTYNWRCDRCNTRVKEVYDKKKSKVVPIDQLVQYDGPTVKPNPTD